MFANSKFVLKMSEFQKLIQIFNYFLNSRTFFIFLNIFWIWEHFNSQTFFEFTKLFSYAGTFLDFCVNISEFMKFLFENNLWIHKHFLNLRIFKNFQTFFEFRMNIFWIHEILLNLKTFWISQTFSFLWTLFNSWTFLICEHCLIHELFLKFVKIFFSWIFLNMIIFPICKHFLY